MPGSRPTAHRPGRGPARCEQREGEGRQEEPGQARQNRDRSAQPRLRRCHEQPEVRGGQEHECSVRVEDPDPEDQQRQAQPYRGGSAPSRGLTADAGGAQRAAVAARTSRPAMIRATDSHRHDRGTVERQRRPAGPAGRARLTAPVTASRRIQPQASTNGEHPEPPPTASSAHMRQAAPADAEERVDAVSSAGISSAPASRRIAQSGSSRRTVTTPGLWTEERASALARSAGRRHPRSHAARAARRVRRR